MRSIILLVLAVPIIVLVAGCTGTGQAPPSATPAAPAGTAATVPASASGFTLHVGSVEPNGALPKEYTCVGGFSSPPVSWENVPKGTETLTLIMEDPDAPAGTYTHWIVYNIPPSRKSLPAGIGAVKEIDGGGQQGTNSNGERGYAAACPPIGSRHNYVFTLYAVDYTMPLPTADREGIRTALNDHWIAKSVVTATFAR